MWTTLLLLISNGLWVWWGLREFIKTKEELERVTKSYEALVEQIEMERQHKGSFVKREKAYHHEDREAKGKKPKYKHWLQEYDNEE